MELRTAAGRGAMPKHSQVREALEHLCHTQLRADDAIPSERELMATFEVSRATIRRAIGDLVTEGVLVRSPGRGTFVAPQRIDSHLHLASFTQDMRKRGHLPATMQLSLTRERPPARVAAFFQSPPTEPHWLLERLRLADGEPMAYEIGWYNAALTPGLDQMDPAASLYETFAADYGLTVDTAEQLAYARTVAGHQARCLEVPEGHPVLAFDRQSCSQRRPLEMMTSLYRGDRYRVHMSLDLSMASERTHARGFAPPQKGNTP
ncbi:GntR family transcriptional regulator [Gephyromycinifex aptenodytis]|uniref:GntR family transcriptional regulator n=1 Tax=Gephyromycinifex aptenodytis TaxID=2716227 RepID=UPI00144619FC|nr:GntR family transcriptional regulator [Gephyromycinifex aptenodytis]